jgi:aminoglycoside 2'-N-acetyltransferase I
MSVPDPKRAKRGFLPPALGKGHVRQMEIEEWDGEASRALISGLRDAVYPPEVLATIVWRNVTSDRAARRIIVSRNGEVIATAGALWRAALLDEQSVHVGGIGGVMTMPDLQRQGVGRIAVAAAVDLLRREQSPDFGVLFCEEKNVGFYQKLGWSRFEGTVEVQQPAGRITYDIMPTMVAPMRSIAPVRGNLDLVGLPW